MLLFSQWQVQGIKPRKAVISLYGDDDDAF